MADPEIEAFTREFESYRPMLAGLVRRILRGPEEDVEDVLQTTWIKAVSSLGRRRAPSKSWMARIAVNTALDELRRRKRRRHDSLNDDAHPVEILDPTPSARSQMAAHENIIALRTGIRRLTPAMQEAIRRVDLEEAPEKLAAAALDINVTTLKTRRFHARAHLRTYLKAA